MFILSSFPVMLILVINIVVGLLFFLSYYWRNKPIYYKILSETFVDLKFSVLIVCIGLFYESAFTILFGLVWLSGCFIYALFLKIEAISR